MALQTVLRPHLSDPPKRSPQAFLRDQLRFALHTSSFPSGLPATRQSHPVLRDGQRSLAPARASISSKTHLQALAELPGLFLQRATAALGLSRRRSPAQKQDVSCNYTHISMHASLSIGIIYWAVACKKSPLMLFYHLWGGAGWGQQHPGWICCLG